MKLLYDITREISGRKEQHARPIKDNSGNPLMSAAEQAHQFKVHFENILNIAEIAF